MILWLSQNCSKPSQSLMNKNCGCESQSQKKKKKYPCELIIRATIYYTLTVCQTKQQKPQVHYIVLNSNLGTCLVSQG